jgi:hypothetical protein
MALAPKSVFPLNFRPFFFPNPPRPSCANCVWGACNKPYAVPVRCSYVVPWRRGGKPCINTGGPPGIPLSCLGVSRVPSGRGQGRCPLAQPMIRAIVELW